MLECAVGDFSCTDAESGAKICHIVVCHASEHAAAMYEDTASVTAELVAEFGSIGFAAVYFGMCQGCSEVDIYAASVEPLAVGDSDIAHLCLREHLLGGIENADDIESASGRSIAVICLATGGLTSDDICGTSAIFTDTVLEETSFNLGILCEEPTSETLRIA